MIGNIKASWIKKKFFFNQRWRTKTKDEKTESREEKIVGEEADDISYLHQILIIFDVPFSNG